MADVRVRSAWRLTAVALGVFLMSAGRCLAQEAPPAVAFGQTDRDRLFEELQRDVASMERELSIYKRVAQLVAPSVVHVQATPLESYRFDRDVEEAGSGVVVRIGASDYVLTNRHVIRHSDTDHIHLELADGRQLTPSKVLSDRQTDVALLVIDAPELTPARMGNSDQMQIGDVVMAFGSPFNLRHSVTRGIISGMGRSNLDLEDGGVEYQNFMQTDAAINPGNSGGPLVNLRGEVIGLNTAIASNSGGNDGIGFAIPINIAATIMRQLAESGRVDFGFLGVTLDALFDTRAALLLGLPRLTGTRVKGVTAQSPAEVAGLETDDVILRYNGVAIENDQHLISLVNLTEIGRDVELTLMRRGQMLVKQAHIGRRGDFVPAAAVEEAGAGR